MVNQSGNPKTAAIGFGVFGSEAIRQASGNIPFGREQILYAEGERPILDFVEVASKNKHHDTISNHVANKSGLEILGAVFLVLDVEEYTRLEGIRAYCEQLRCLGVFTIAVAKVSRKQYLSERRPMAEQALDNLAGVVDGIILLADEESTDPTRPYVAVTEILSSLDGIITGRILQKDSVSIDFEDLMFILKYSGMALFGVAEAQGPDRAAQLIEKALPSPFMTENFVRINPSPKVLLNIIHGTVDELEMEELTLIANRIVDIFGDEIELLLGISTDKRLNEMTKVELVVSANFLHFTSNAN